MTTYTISTSLLTFDGDEMVSDAQPVEFSIFTDDATTGFSYVIDLTDGTFNEIDIDDTGIQALMLDGTSDPAIADGLDGIQTLTHSGGQETAFLVIDEIPSGTGSTTIPLVLAGDPVPVFSNAAEANAFLGTITDESDEIPIGFEPNTFIEYTSIPGATVTESDNVTGSDLADYFVGGIGQDTLKGGKGKDTLDGGDGADVLKGQKGKDTLTGGKKGDDLNGGEGHDKLTGSKGNDTLTGGAGNDKFIFKSTTHGKNTVTDFEDGADAIDLKALNIGFDDLTIKKTDGGMNTKVVYLDLQITLNDVAKSDVDAGDFLF